MTPRQARMLAELMLWSSIVFILTVTYLTVMVRVAFGETCYYKPSELEPRKGGYRWQWRNVDAKQCWYYSNRVLPREDLVWSFSEEEFNSDVDRIIERKFYSPAELEGMNSEQLKRR